MDPTQQITEAVSGWRHGRAGVVVVAIDGHGGAGKTTIAGTLASALRAAVVHMDDFFVDMTPEQARSIDPRLGVEQYYDWPRLRAEALEPLRERRAARFVSCPWRSLDDTSPSALATVEPDDLVLLEGVYAAGPKLADLVDARVLVETPVRERELRLRERISEESWDEVWLAAERAYFSSVVPPPGFDLVVSGSASASVRLGSI
jgi:uridine kinase